MIIVPANWPSLDEVERMCIVQNLNNNDLDFDKTAKVLGIDARTLKRRVKGHQVKYKEMAI